jgi:tetratricopeptide (TPR) repeat protein
MSEPSEPGESLQDRFERARGLAPAERARFLAALEADDPAAAARLRAFLEAAGAGDSPLDADPWVAAGDSADEESAEEALPERIGPYRIVSEIGRGGMGRVYLGLQEGEGYSRRLAVKVVSPEGSGPAIERRFRTERAILATLEHPGIARFHDAGRDPEAGWYLALEYVDGVGLIEHARAKRLTSAERVRLFLAVLEPVAYAHAHGVVHRDLKPANILVGEDGHPRLLDFGIAKLLEPAAGGAAVTQTRTALRAMTPAYASPEQFRGDPATPASDVFSLGVVLYELVAGVRPFGGEGSSQMALERAVLESEPAAPSTASRRSAEPGEVTKRLPEHGRLRHDLDAICLKALEKEPERRYATAAEMAADVERYLSGRPVAAPPAGLRFGRRWARRWAALTAALAAAAVVLALALVPRRDGAVAAPSEPIPKVFPFHDVAGRDLPELEKAFTAAPGDLEAGARLVLALSRAGRHDEAALAFARLRQIPGKAADPLIPFLEAGYTESGSEPQRVLVLYGEALERAVAGGRGELVPTIRFARGDRLLALGRTAEAKVDLDLARRDFERAGDRRSLNLLLNVLAGDALKNGRLAEGEALLEQVLAAYVADGRSAPALTQMNLAVVATTRGFPDRAEPRLRDAVAAYRASGARLLGYALYAHSRALAELDRAEEAKRQLDEAIDYLRTVDAVNELAYALLARGEVRLRARDAAGAEAVARELEEYAKHTGLSSALGLSNRLRGEAAALAGDFSAARLLLGKARRQLVESAMGDIAEELDAAWGEIELAANEPEAAREAAGRLRPDPAAPIEKTTQFLAESILVRAEAREGHADAAARRFAALEKAAAGRTSVRWRRALDQARAAVGGGPT